MPCGRGRSFSSSRTSDRSLVPTNAPPGPHIPTCALPPSLRWLADNEPDPEQRHYQAILQACEAYTARPDVRAAHGHKLKHVYVWVDYCSVPQRGSDAQQLAIDTIGFYTSVCSAFIIVCPPAAHARTGHVCDFASYSNRCWCRVECLTCILGDAAFGQLGGTHAATIETSEAQANGLAHMFLASGDGLKPLQLWEARGNDDQYHQGENGAARRMGKGVPKLCAAVEPLLYPYEGELTCCRLNHERSGLPMRCDKTRLVDVLVGLYGHVLMKTVAKGTGDEDVDCAKAKAVRELAEHTGRMFPSEYFGRSIEAMHEFLGQQEQPDAS